jgi:hypothetical protein
MDRMVQRWAERRKIVPAAPSAAAEYRQRPSFEELSIYENRSWKIFPKRPS